MAHDHRGMMHASSRPGLLDSCCGWGFLCDQRNDLGLQARGDWREIWLEIITDLRTTLKSNLLPIEVLRELLTNGTWNRVPAGDSVLQGPTGLIFWLKRKKFVGSYFFLSATSRAYVCVPYAAWTAACGSSDMKFT